MKTIKYRVTCISQTYIHTLSTLQTDTVSETFKETMAGKKSGGSDVQRIEFEPVNEIIKHDYIV